MPTSWLLLAPAEEERRVHSEERVKLTVVRKELICREMSSEERVNLSFGVIQPLKCYSPSTDAIHNRWWCRCTRHREGRWGREGGLSRQ